MLKKMVARPLVLLLVFSFVSRAFSEEEDNVLDRNQKETRGIFKFLQICNVSLTSSSFLIIMFAHSVLLTRSYLRTIYMRLLKKPDTKVHNKAPIRLYLWLRLFIFRN